MKQKILNIAIYLTITVAGIFIYHSLFRKEVKLAYIKTGVILSNYTGMKMATEQLNKELETVQANIDTLKRRYEQLKMKESEIKPNEKTEWAKQLGVAEYEYNNYRASAQQQMEERRNQLNTEVINKINSFIKDYGKENDHDIIFGATDQGSILYGKEPQDITDIILKKLNEEYTSEAKNK